MRRFCLFSHDLVVSQPNRTIGHIWPPQESLQIIKSYQNFKDMQMMIFTKFHVKQRSDEEVMTKRKLLVSLTSYSPSAEQHCWPYLIPLDVFKNHEILPRVWRHNEDLYKIFDQLEFKRYNTNKLLKFHSAEDQVKQKRAFSQVLKYG